VSGGRESSRPRWLLFAVLAMLALVGASASRADVLAPSRGANPNGCLAEGPNDTVAPTLNHSGNGPELEPLTLTEGTWVQITGSCGNRVSQVAWAFLRNGSTVLKSGTFTGASGGTASYTTVAADLNQSITAQVNACDNLNECTLWTSAVYTPRQAPTPGTPSITGTDNVGQQLTAHSGTWGGFTPLTYVYAWYRCQNASDTPGQGTCTTVDRTSSSTSSTTDNYTAVSGDFNDYLKVVVTATNAAGSASANSAATGQVGGQAPTAGSTAISGTAQAGQPLTATPSSFTLGTPTATYSYQWMWSATSNGTYSNVSSGGTSQTYTVAPAYANDYLKAVATATNTCSSGCGSASATSAASSQVLPAAPSGGSVSISGLAQVGNGLSATACSAEGWSPASPTPSCTFQWQVSATGTGGWSNASGSGNATSSYTVASADYNQYLRVQVVASNPGGSSSPVYSSATGQVLPAAPSGGSVSISGSARVGNGLTATACSGQGWSPASPAPSCAYQWQVSANGTSGWSNAAGSGNATSSYTVASADYNQYLRVQVVASNPGGSSSPVYSSATSQVGGQAPTSGSAAISGSAQSGHTLTATPSGFSLGTPAASYSFQWQYATTSTGVYNSIPGATASSYSIGSTYDGDYLEVTITASNSCSSGCGSASATSAATSAVTAGSDYPTTVLGNSPSAYWRLGEASGSDFADSSGSGNDLTLTQPVSPSGVPGTYDATGDVYPDDGGYQFNFDDGSVRPDGEGTYWDTDSNGLSLAPTMQATMSSGYPSGTNAYSLEAWVKPVAENSNDNHLFPGQIVGNLWAANATPCLDNQPVGTNLSYQPAVGHDEGVFVFERANGGCPVTNDQTYSIPVSPSQWYYVVATYNGATMRLYVDGTLLSQQPSSIVSIGTAANDKTISIGNSSFADNFDATHDHFKGTIDEPAVYDYALSAGQIQSHYAYGLSSNQNYSNPPSVPHDPGGATLSTYPSSEFSGQCSNGNEPSEWTSNNFSVLDSRYYLDEGYLLQAEVTNATNPIGSGSQFGASYDGGSIFLVNNNVNNGWQTVNDSNLVGPNISYWIYPACLPNTSAINVSWRWIFSTDFLGSMPCSYWYGGSNAAAPGLCQCEQGAGDPVNSANGDYSDTYTDAKVGVFGPPLSFARTYDSSMAQAQATAGTPGPLGYGWTDNWNLSLSVSSGTVTISQANGAQVTFKAPSGGSCSSPYVGSGASGTYCALPDVTASLTYSSASSTYTFVTHNPYQSYTFNSSGQLSGESGPGGATLTLAGNTPAPGSGNCPSGASSCMTVTSASGRALVIGSNSSGFVTSVTDPLARRWLYAYCSPPSSTCSSGDLVQVTDPRGKVTTYTYDEGNSNSSLTHDLLTVTRPNGQPGAVDAGDKLVNVYNSSGLVTSQTDPAGNQTTFDYSHLDSSGTGYTLVTDPDGNQTQYRYNNHVLVGRVLGYGSSSPSTWTYRPDPSTLLDDSVIDPNNNETDYLYNRNGDLITKINPLGAVWSYSYNDFDQPTCAALPLSNTLCSTLSAPAAIPAGSSTISPPSSAPPKYVTYSQYDTNGNPIWTTTGDYNPGSSSASQSRTSYQLYNGESVTLGGSNDSCTASAPDSSLACATINPDGVVTQLGYDSSGDVNSAATPDGNSGGELATTTSVYDSDGELSSVTAPDGNLAGATAATYTTSYGYNDDGQLTTKTVSHTGGSITARTTSYGYDDNGNQISVTDPRSKETDYKYTPDDQLTLVTDPDNQKTLTCYDGDGQIAETVPAVGVAANSLTPASCPSSYPSGYGNRLAADATTYSYDPLGDKTTITSPAPAGQTGHETTTNAYDPDGRLTTSTAPPASNDSGAHNQVTTYDYDDADELTSITKASGTSAASTTSYCYDPNGDKTAAVEPDGNTSTVASCATSAPYQTSSNYQTGYSFDSLGELVSETRPATTAAPSGQTTSYTYDPAGNQLTSQDPNGVTTTSTYTPLNQLASVSYSGSSAHPVSYGYDANGNRVSMNDASGSSSYQYDPFNELASSQNGNGQTLTYTYNDDGQTSAITYPLGAGASWATSDTIAYGYDNADELNSITDFNGNTITIGSTADGLPKSLSLGSSGDTISTTYDQTDTPSDISLANSSSTLLDLAYSNTPSGAISSETTTPTTSTSPADYDYDAQNRVTQMTPGSGSNLNYTFDASGNLTTLPAGASGNYDNASELTSSTLSSTTTNYTYDSDGQRLQASRGGSTIASASYNGAQELASYSNSSANMSAATYDGDDLRTASTTTPNGGSATTQHYLWDTSGPTPQLVMDSTNAYIYGPGTAPIEQINLSTGTITYLLSDRLGSVRGTINTSGTLTNTTSYDAWGNPQTTGGLTNHTPFGYAGNYTDPTNLTYNIRRYYDPVTGQFISIDPLVDQTEAPYAYVNGDPVDGTDPLGLGCFLSVCTHSFDPMASVDAWINIGRGATFGLTDQIANWIVPGASCTVAQDSLDQFIGAAATTVLGGEALGALLRSSRFAAGAPDFAEGNLDHIFRDAPGHLAEDTPENRALLQSAVRSGNYVRTGGGGEEVYRETLPDGTQVWAEVFDGKITNGGVNQTPRP
jgi:RHS repeat-associated protein